MRKLLVFCAMFISFAAGATSVPASAEAVPPSANLVVTSDVPSTDGTRCDAIFVGTGLSAYQVVSLDFEGSGKTNKGASIELTADATGRVTQTVNTVGTPMVGNGTYWVKLTSANKVLTKVRVVFSCG